MGDVSIIEWTDSTWNPWRGCDKVSPGCADCYMFRDQRRYGRDPEVVVRAADGTFFAPIRSRKWEREREAAITARGRHFVFTCSWSDWFHETADPWREEAWEIIRETPRSIYQILTKRPERILDHLPDDWGDGYPNVWMGTTIENRAFVGRADLLRAVPAAVRFVSAEPLLGPLVFYGSDGQGEDWVDGLSLDGIDWIIVGGESGGRPGRALVDEFGPKSAAKEWITDLRDEAAASGTAFFFKQWGGRTPKAGGRLLDGREWNEMPAALPSVEEVSPV
jgi:protein gp37